MAGLVPEILYPENRPGMCLNAPFVSFTPYIFPPGTLKLFNK